MKTFQLKPEKVKRSWHLMDASDQIVGHLAGKIAKILRGKHRPDFTPHVDGGDYVVLVNCEKVTMTGKKPLEKKYYHHSGYPGGLKTTTFERLIESHPDRVIRNAVHGMLPKNKLRARMLQRFKVFQGPEHSHSAQLTSLSTEESKS